MGSDSHPRTLRFSPLFSRRIGYLHLSRIFRQFKSSYNLCSKRKIALVEEGSPFRCLGQSSVLYALFGASLETGLFSLPVKGDPSVSGIHLSPAGTTPRHSGLFPPFGRASINRRQTLRLGLRSSGTAPHFLPVGIPVSRSRVIPQGTGTGYPRRFSPMQAFRQLPLPKASASQNGFHPAYALRSGITRRNSLQYSLFNFQGARLTETLLFFPAHTEYHRSMLLSLNRQFKKIKRRPRRGAFCRASGRSSICLSRLHSAFASSNSPILRNALLSRERGMKRKTSADNRIKRYRAHRSCIL